MRPAMPLAGARVATGFYMAARINAYGSGLIIRTAQVPVMSKQ